MTKLDIVHCIADNHNRLARVMVSGDDAIIMGSVLVELRKLINVIQKDIEAENSDADERKGRTDENS